MKVPKMCRTHGLCPLSYCILLHSLRAMERTQAPFLARGVPKNEAGPGMVYASAWS